MSKPSAELIARFREKKFVPDRRCDGWWATTLTRYLGPLDTPYGDNVMLLTIREFIRQEVFCRYRIYYYQMTVFNISVREEDVEHLYEALKLNFENEITTPDFFEDNKIFWEVVPSFTELYEITNKYITSMDSCKAKLPVRTQKERIQYNLFMRTINHVAERFIIDFPERHNRDKLIRRTARKNFRTLNEENADVKWKQYQNIWALRDRIDELCPRTAEDGDPILHMYFPITKEQYLTFFADHPEEQVENEEQIDDSEMVVPNNTTDNPLMKNIDIVKGRGMYLSYSHTYEKWRPPKPEEANETPVQQMFKRLVAAQRPN